LSSSRLSGMGIIMAFGAALNRFLTYCMYLLGVRKEDPVYAGPPVPERPEKPLVGTNGPIEAEVLVMREENRVVMVVDYDFEDIPEWIEWDVGRGVIGIVQMGGAVAEVKSVIPPEKSAMFKETTHLVLATRFEGRRMMHSIYLVVRS
jgi:hypothetical protein